MLRKLIFVLLLPMPALAETYSVTADGGMPCDTFSGTIKIENGLVAGRLSSPSSSGFYFNAKLENGRFNAVGMGMYGAIRIAGTAEQATITLYSPEADCQGNLFLKPERER